MDTLSLATRLHAMHRTLNDANPRLSEQCQIGPMLVTVDASSREPFASSNRNRAAAAGAALSHRDFEALAAFWQSRNISRHFLWLSPGSDDAASINLALQHGYSIVPYMRYMVLGRPSLPVLPSSSTQLRVVGITGESIDVYSDALVRIYVSDHAPATLRAMCGVEGCEVLGVMDGSDLIAAAMVYCRGEVAYLGWAVTREDARGRGAQSVLIAERVRIAAERGCVWCASETNSMGAISLRNLGKAGFVPRYEMVVMTPTAFLTRPAS